MSQQPDSSSSKKMTFTSVPESNSGVESINPNKILEVAPLRMVTTNDLKVKKPRTPHARRPKENVSGNASNTSSSIPHEDLTREGFEYVNNAIAQIVTRILNEKHEVPGISIPLKSVIPKPHLNKEPDVNQDVETMKESLGKNDDDVHHADVVHNDGDDVDVTKDVNDNAETGTDTGTGTNVVNLDDYSDNDLVASVNPSIAKRLRTRKGKKVVVQSPPKRIAVPKSTSVGPTKSWSKVVPKKRKAKVIADSDFDVACDVPNIPPKKKPTSSKLAARVPDVPIDNISFHSASSVNRWKYVYQKRLALERELAQNALECKEIMGLIHDAGLLKTVAHFSKCYEMPVK
ncbi:uncharacterized protein LOC131661285 [Vicia villosa]|uniref:uncharacterized protein LOC131661285 n=1 Tax=Vicia villosa TaxID=3911 RepID=UPI00273B28C1|nr:uncharacterized protein LOC131661285 [Vicia villosa]